MVDCGGCSLVGNFNNVKKGYMMQKVQIGGGFISPAVMAHVQKSSMQLKSTESGSKEPSATQIGGGIISPNVKKHVAESTKANMGGGVISPDVKKHVAKSTKVNMGGGVIHPHIAKHVQAQ